MSPVYCSYNVYFTHHYAYGVSMEMEFKHSVKSLRSKNPLSTEGSVKYYQALSLS